jgi:hypothetical protein
MMNLGELVVALEATGSTLGSLLPPPPVVSS